MSETPENQQTIPNSIQNLADQFADAFTEKNAEKLDELFDENAIHVLTKTKVLRGDDRRAATKKALSEMTGSTSSELDRVFIADNIALIFNHYRHIGFSDQGTKIERSGTAIDVARRDEAGHWKILISNPNGAEG